MSDLEPPPAPKDSWTYTSSNPGILGQQSVTCYVEEPINIDDLKNLKKRLGSIQGYKFTIQCYVIA